MLGRSRGLRELVAALRWATNRRQMPDLAHLALFSDNTTGPVQRDEALMLFSLVRMVRARTVVEIGFHHGHSALNFLAALEPDARLYSFDIDPRCEAIASQRFGRDPRLVYRTKAQEDLSGEDLDGRTIDLVFLDGAHDLDLNRSAFGRLLPLMAPKAIMAIHDTGTVPRALIPPDHWTTTIPARWVGDECEHQPDERAFVNWLLETHPEFAQIHLHSRETLRWGMTLLQRSEPLPRPQGARH
jgi:predicted O-methyltransferase YrrM